MNFSLNVTYPVREAQPLPTPPVSVHSGGVVNGLFRFLLLYIGIQLLPIDGLFFQNLINTEGGYTAYWFALSKYAPRFFGPADSFTNWAVVAILAGAGAIVWSTAGRYSGSEEKAYAWLRIAVRYRLALAVTAYGFIKLFPIQAPLPSLSQLNTAYGDHSAWKLFSLSLGIVPGYESFLGAVEVVGGLSLLHRKTTALATLILLPFLGNVFFSNLAYEGGEYVYSGLLITFALFLFAHDAVRLFQLVSLGLPARPDRPVLLFRGQSQTVRWVLKTAFVGLAVVLYGISTGFTSHQARFPQTPGVEGTAGLYRVTEFRWNGQTIPYSRQAGASGAVDRWQDVVFESWNTMSIRSNRPAALHTANTETLPRHDGERDFEEAGSSGRHYYRYTADPTKRVLTLRNRYASASDPNRQLTLSLTRQNDSTLILAGVNARRDSVYARLTSVNRKYLLHEAAKAGRRTSLTL